MSNGHDSLTSWQKVTVEIIDSQNQSIIKAHIYALTHMCMCINSSLLRNTYLGVIIHKCIEYVSIES